jgi:cell wall-associated NlpC family hydrolase
MSRWLSVTGAAALLMGLCATSGEAAPGDPVKPAPTTSTEATAQVKAYNEQFEKVTEQFNDARILSAKRLAEARAARAKVQLATRREKSFQLRIKQLVKSQARTDPYGTWGAMISSGSPDEFAAQVSVIDVVASRRAAVLVEASKARAAAAKAAADADRAKAAADKLTKDLAAKRTDLAKREAQSKALLALLTASERKAYLDSQNEAPAPRASRDETRVAPAPEEQAPVVTAPASGGAATAIAVAKSKLGSPYVWAAAGPNVFDCSGLTMYAWAAAGVSLPHSSAMQMSSGTRVSISSMQPGDLVFYGSPVHHVALYVGSGQVIHAPQSGDVVRYASVNMMPITGVTRP